MKFMIMHKADRVSESEPEPTPELIANVGKMVQGARASGAMIDGAGLRASAYRARVKLAGGKRTVERGPYRGDNELVSSVSLLKVKDLDEGISWGTRLAEAAGATEVEVGTVTEPWDLGVAPKPEGEVPVQVLAVIKATAASERGEAPGKEELEKVVEEATKKGVFVRSHSLRESARGSRIRGEKGARHVIDGPFAESKELVGGFMVMMFTSKDEALTFAREYADVVGAEEVDVREVL